MGVHLTFGKQEDEGKDIFAVHHMLPWRHGGIEVGDVEFVPPPEVNIEAANQPVNPGFAPLRHVRLPSPREFMPVPPPQVTIAAQMSSPAVVTTARPTFPVPEAPRFQKLSSAPPASSAEIPAASPRHIDPAPGVQVVKPMIEDEEPSLFERIDPLYAVLVYLAFGLGTLVLEDPETRYTVLWSLLAVMGGTLTLMDTRRAPRGSAATNLIWGSGIGLVIGILLIPAASGLAATSKLLFPGISLPALFQALVFLGPLGETLFFRGVVQERRGFVASVIGAGVGTLIFYWPAGGSAPVSIVAVAGFLTMLAAIYCYVRQRFGLAAAYTCQVTLNVMLFLVPRLLINLPAP